MPIPIHPPHRIISHIPIQIQRLRIIQLGIWHRLFLRTPVRTQPPPHRTRKIPRPKIIIPALGVPLLAGKVLLGGIRSTLCHRHPTHRHRRQSQPIPKRQTPIPRRTRPGRIDLHTLRSQPVRQCEIRIGPIIGRIQLRPGKNIRMRPTAHSRRDRVLRHLLPARPQHPALLRRIPIRRKVATEPRQIPRRHPHPRPVIHIPRQPASQNILKIPYPGILSPKPVPAPTTTSSHLNPPTRHRGPAAANLLTPLTPLTPLLSNPRPLTPEP